jgi:hypothetical protein
MNLQESIQVFDCHIRNVTVGIIQQGAEIRSNRWPLCVSFAITSLTKNCNQKQSCCNVTYCPLVLAWATTIHKFQGFEAGFDKNDQFKNLIVDPGNLTTKLQNPGITATTTSSQRAPRELPESSQRAPISKP